MSKLMWFLFRFMATALLGIIVLMVLGWGGAQAHAQGQAQIQAQVQARTRILRLLPLPKLPENQVVSLVKYGAGRWGARVA